jgi:hypothetical protein
VDEVQWSEAVRDAHNADDRASLRTLFAKAVDEWGHEVASDRWLRLMSESDSTAQTG